MVINLIATSRNVSTTLMYSFAQHPDVKVVDEPFLAYYLALSDADHPSKDDVMRELPQNMNAVLNLINTLDKEYPIVFVKNMAPHLLEVTKGTFSSYTNVFLTQKPDELIAGYCEEKGTPDLEDIGVKEQWERFEAQKNKGLEPLTIDSDTLLNDPESSLKALCEKLGISFDEKMLSWEKGAIEEDGSWAKHWYSEVHNSTGFEKSDNGDVELSGQAKKLCNEALPYYQKLSEHTLRL